MKIMQRVFLFLFASCSRQFRAMKTKKTGDTKVVAGFGTIHMDDRNSSQNSSSPSPEVPGERQHVSCCNPSSRVHRYTVLALLCFLSIANDYCGDIPSALQDRIQADLNVNTTKYSLLNSVGAWPNVFLCLIGGVILDRWLGVRRGAIIFASIVSCGQLIFTIGCFIHSFTVVVIGRFIFGVGSDSLSFCGEVYCVRWFLKRGQYNFAFSLSFTIARLASSLSLWINPPLYEKMSSPSTHNYSTLGYTSAFGLIFCAVSLYVALQLAWLDRRAERIQKNSLLHNNSARVRAYTTSAQNSDDGPATGTSSHVVKLKDLFHLPLSLWLLCFMCAGFYCAVSPFIGQSNLFFQRKYDYDSRSANECTSLIYFLAAGASPVAGFLIDRTSRNLTWMIAGCVLGVVCLLLLTFTFISPYLMMVLYGLALTMFAGAFWSAIAYTVPYNKLATSYGLVTSILNLGLSLSNMAAGSLVDNYGYMAMLILFTASTCASLFFAFGLLFVDVRQNGSAINASSKNRKAAIAKKEQNEEQQEAKNPIIVVAGAADDTPDQSSTDDAESAFNAGRPGTASPNLAFDAHEE